MLRATGFEKDVALLYEQADRAPAGSEERRRLLRAAGQLSGAQHKARAAKAAAAQARRRWKGQRHV